MALDIRDLDSSRFRNLQTSAAELHQRLMSSKKDKTSLDEDEDLGYKVLGDSHHSTYSLDLECTAPDTL